MSSLTRRALLRALGTAAIALPALELTNTVRGQGSEKPKRFVLMYGGLSASHDGAGRNLLAPGATGAGFDLPRSLASLGTADTPYGDPGYGVQEHVSVVSGLKIPWGNDGQIPPGGKSARFHYNTAEQQTTGVRRGNNASKGPGGTTVDLLLADKLHTEMHQSLSYRIQAARYVGPSTEGGGGLHALSQRLINGNVQHMDATVSPKLAYQGLFSGFVPPEPEGRERAVKLQGRRRSILSALHRRTSSISSQLGAYDRQRIEQHLDALTDLENRLARAATPMGASACAVPSAPGDDPPIADGHRTMANGNLIYTPSVGYSKETERGNLLVDMLPTAFACDLTRSAAVRISLDQTFINGEIPVNANLDMHGLTHSGRTGSLEDALGWHVSFMARLIASLRDTLDVDGTPMLDSTNVVLLFEGGNGYDPEGRANNKAHSTENMVVLVGGGLGVNGGQHFRTNEQHPAEVFNSILPSYDMPDQLGEVSGKIDGLVG